MADNELKKMSYEDYLTNVINNAGTNYDTAVKNAAIARDKQIGAANNYYQRALSQYGKQAESLSASGLQGSGFSKYLDSKAYAQKQADINAAYQTEANTVAAAEATRDAAQLEAKGLMADYLAQQEANRVNAYNNLYGNLSGYNGNDISNIATANGITDEAMVNQLIEAKQRGVYNDFSGSSYTMKELDAALASGNLSQSDYDKLKEGVYKISDNITENYFTDEEGNLKSYATANQELEALEAAGVDTTKARELFDKVYGVHTHTKVGEDELVVRKANRGGDGKSGANVVIDIGDQTFRLEFKGGESADENVKNAAKTVTSNIFAYGNKIYYKNNDKVYELKGLAGGNKSANVYNYILSILKGTATEAKTKSAVKNP